MKKILIFVIAITQIAATRVFAEMTWEVKTQEIEIPIGTNTGKFEFPFKNSGLEKMEIVDIKTSCGCTVPDLEKRTYLPGESGKLIVNFTSGRATGRIEKEVIVETNDKVNKYTTLTIKALVPPIAAFFPEYLEWKVSEEATEKEIILTISKDLDLQVLDVMPTHDNFQVTLKAIEPGKLYRLKVKPDSTKFPCKSSFRLETTLKDFKYIYCFGAVSDRLP